MEWLKIVGWFGMTLMFLASIATGDFVSYLLQGIFLLVVLLHSYKKTQARTIILVGSLLLLLIRMVTYSGAIDLVDIALWGLTFYFTL